MSFKSDQLEILLSVYLTFISHFLDARKPDFAACKHEISRQACAYAQNVQGICYTLS